MSKVKFNSLDPMFWTQLPNDQTKKIGRKIVDLQIRLEFYKKELEKELCRIA